MTPEHALLHQATLRRWVAPLRKTPLHPQWFAFRDDVRIRRWIHDAASGHVLDIGCANGWARKALQPECGYTGLDFPTTASGMYGTRPDVFADGCRLPFVDGAFDTVLLLEVLEHVSDPVKALCEIRRVLKSGGLLLLSMPFLYPLHDAPHDYQRYTAPGLAHALSEAGLEARSLQPRNRGFEAAGLLWAIACADSLLSALKERRWRLVFAPLLACFIPLVNGAAWLLSPLSGTDMLAGGHVVAARKP